jgi:hypothetical protein
MNFHMKRDTTVMVGENVCTSCISEILSWAAPERRPAVHHNRHRTRHNARNHVLPVPVR